MATEKEKFAAERSHSDATSVNDHARAAVQTIIIVNGGAATALLAFASTDTGVHLTQSIWVFAGLVCYIAGVILGSINVYFLTATCNTYLIAWSKRAHADPEEEINGYFKKASRFEKYGRNCFVIRIVLFVVGSFIVGVAVLFFPSVQT